MMDWICKKKKRTRGRHWALLFLAAVMAVAWSAVPVLAEEDDEGENSDIPIVQYVTDLFTDVSSDQWFAEPVQKAYSLGLMQGENAVSFSPEGTMSRAMFVQVLYNLADRPYMEDPQSNFSDLDYDAWYFPAACWAYDNHIVSGLSEDLFGPDDPITREQAVKMLYSYAGVVQQTEPISGFIDMDVIDDWAAESICWAVNSGILKGSSEEDQLYLFPLKELRRCEAASLLASFCEVQYQETVEVTLPEETHITSSEISLGVKIPSLMYHEVSDDVWGLSYLFVSPSNMRDQISWLLTNGYDPIFYSDLTHLWDYDKPVLLTFDDGYQGNYDNLFPLLKEFNVKATIFVVTDEIGQPNRLTASEIKEMSDSGLVSIQSHTHTHSILSNLSTEELLVEFQQSKTIISSITGKSPYVISYPEGSSTVYSRSLASAFFSFGVQDRNGPWTTTSNLFLAKRVTISRDLTLTKFAAVVKR